MQGWVSFILGKESKPCSERAILTEGAGGIWVKRAWVEALGYLPALSTSFSTVLCMKVWWITGNPLC